MKLSDLGDNSLQILRDAGFLKGMYIPKCLGQPVHVVSLYDDEEARSWGRPGQLALAFEYKDMWFWIATHYNDCAVHGPAPKDELAYRGFCGYPFMAIKKHVRWWIGEAFRLPQKKVRITDEEALDYMIAQYTKKRLEG